MPSEGALTILEGLDEAIADESFDEAETLLEDLVSEYDVLRREEAVLGAEALAVRDRVDPTQGESAQPFTSFVQTSSGTSMGRAGVMLGTRQFLLDPGAGGASDLRAQIDELREQEQAFLDAETEVRAALDNIDADLPAELVLSRGDIEDGPYVPGQPYELTATVANIGDDKAESVRIRVEAPDGVTASPGSLDLGTLGPDEEWSNQFSLTAASAGEYTVTVYAESDDLDTDSQTATFSVVGPDNISKQALEVVRRAQTRLGESDLKRGQAQSLQSKLETAETKIDQGRAQLKRGNHKRADNQFEAASRVLGAFLNTLESNGKPSRELTATTHTSLKNLAATAIDQLALAQRA